MLNKYFFKLIILSFFLLIANVVNGDDQFNFDVTTIEITDNGNRFTGYDRGEITTSDGLLINADSFDYFKNTNILKAKGNIVIYDKRKDVKIYSDNLTYLKNEGKILTDKNSKAVHKNYIIKAEKFLYDENQNKIVANKKVISEDT